MDANVTLGGLISITTLKFDMISADEKFALVALPRANVADSVTSLSLNSSVWVMRSLPFGMSDYWQQWIGEIRAKELQGVGLFLLTKAHAENPAVLDGENQLLTQKVSRLFDGLIIAEMPKCPTRPFVLTGANVNGDISIRQLSNLRSPVWYAFAQAEILRQINEQALRSAASFGDAIAAINKTNEYVRLKRALSAFFAGVYEERFEERLHQFCRCIDGIVLSRRGKGEADFTARTVLFIGDGHHEVMKDMYRMRSAVEHLRLAESEATGKTGVRGKRLCVIERALQAEAIARHALQGVLLDRNLRGCFGDENKLEDFWRASEKDRRERWGQPLDFQTDLAKVVDPQYVTEHDLGLTP